MEQREALFYKRVKDNILQCELCPRYCVIKENEVGNCGVRKNINGKLYSLVYGKPVSANIDPIEKKPLYHFLPGSKSFSIGTVGCNFHCLNCQNYEISQAKFEEISHMDLPPKKVVEQTIKFKCKSISYTYTEPTVFYEYMLDSAKLAKKKNIKNVMVSNGFINEKPLLELCKYIDAANIDLKAFDDNFYKKICEARLEPVLNTLKILYNKKIWLEVTNLLIPKLNDKEKQIKELCLWIKENLDENVPLHFSRFFPMYKANGFQITSFESLENAYVIAKDIGLKYVYVGNIESNYENTYCPNCDVLLIERSSFLVNKINIKNNKCSKCNKKINGTWK